MVDLSLNYSSVNFLDHSSFLALSGNHSEDIENFFPTAGQVTIDQDSDLCLNHPFILFKDNFLSEALSFIERGHSMRKTMEQLTPFFSQQFGLKNLLMQEACEKVLQPIKKKVLEK